MTAIRLNDVSKHFGNVRAVDRINLKVDEGELFFLLGPSGCGKSTLLRLIAGLHEPTSGQIFFGDRDVTALTTDKRNAVMVFQSYALWPHMSVRENIRFGLAVRKLDRAQQNRAIDRVISLVQMREHLDRKPNQLSGGQQQRIALARALVVNPACLLLDEPLSNLDAKLRTEMRGEIRRICKESGATTIYVTHDQKEALSIADRIALLKEGRLIQVGAPGDLYHNPRTSFVAEFIGSTNLVNGRIVARDTECVQIDTALGRLTARAEGIVGTEVKLSIRPEQMQVYRNGRAPRANRIVGHAVESTFLGESSEHVLVVNKQRIRVIATPPIFNMAGEIAVEFDPENVLVLPE